MPALASVVDYLEEKRPKFSARKLEIQRPTLHGQQPHDAHVRAFSLCLPPSLRHSLALANYAHTPVC
eukprot:scaffold5665_cov92-Skeletonema_dohrnii-CCMP3373.AAC.1